MIAQIAGALLRAVLVAAMVASPSILVPDPSSGSSEVISLVALCFGVFVFIEYVSTYPSLLEFRDAPPFNRMRFLSVGATVILVSIITRGRTDPSTLTEFVSAVGLLFGHILNFPYSPVRLFTLMLSDGAGPVYTNHVLAIAGLSYFITLLTVGTFAALLYLTRWPSHKKPFNVWINLPTFDPTAGGDVVQQLSRDARLNASLGFLLPFLLPLAVYLSALIFDPIALVTPQSLIWTVAAWSFLSTNMMMRGIAMARIAMMIEEKRKRSFPESEDVLLPA
ncbi:MAG: hypothetical protein AAF667_08080 [Pseudomonadota bacterium]